MDEDDLSNDAPHANEIDVEVRPPLLEDKVEPVPQDAEQSDEEMADLFGTEDVQHAHGTPAVSEPDDMPSPEREHRRAMEYEEDDEVPQQADEIMAKMADVAFPNYPIPKSSDGDKWVVRMPNFMKVDSKPYYHETYLGPEHDEEDAHSALKSESIKLRVENTLRWRWIKDESGQNKRQSNARIIRWSDGTMSLRVGKEFFDIVQSVDTSAAAARPGAQAQSTSTPNDPASTPRGQGLSYLVAQHEAAQVLQVETQITGSMSLRPTGMQSETHRMLVRAVGQKHNKVARLRLAPDPTMDPEREKMELAKRESKKSSRKRVDAEAGTRRRKTYSRKRGADVWSDDDDEEEAVGYGVSEDDEGDSRSKRKKPEDGKGGDYQQDDFVVADSSDYEDDEPSSSKRRRRDDDQDEEEDILDKMDAEIHARQEAERMERAKNGSKKAGSDEEEMDVESEDDDDEKVRRAGGASSGRKKRAVYDDDDEDD